MLANNLKVVESDKSKLLLNNKKKKRKIKIIAIQVIYFTIIVHFGNRAWLIELIFPNKLHLKMSLCL